MVDLVNLIRSKLDRLEGKIDLLTESAASLKNQVSSLEKEEELLTLVSAVYRSLIDKEVNEGVKTVSTLMTNALQVVFEDQSLSVDTEIDIQRGKVSLDFLTNQKSADMEVSSSSCEDTFGGSVLSVQSILLRIALILKRQLRPILFLDETLPAFDSNYVTNVATFLSDLCKQFDMDILVVTHNQALFDAADRSYKIVKRNDEAWFERVK